MIDYLAKKAIYRLNSDIYRFFINKLNERIISILGRKRKAFSDIMKLIKGGLL